MQGRNYWAGLPYSFLKVEKNALILEKRARLYPSLG